MKTPQDYIAEVEKEFPEWCSRHKLSIPKEAFEELRSQFSSSLSQIEKDTEKATREKVIAECVAVVPTVSIGVLAAISFSEEAVHHANGFNSCREATLSALNELRK